MHTTIRWCLNALTPVSVGACIHVCMCVCVPVFVRVFVCTHTCNQRAVYRNSGWQPECWGGSSNSWLWVIIISWPVTPWKHDPPLYLDQYAVKCAEFLRFGPLGKASPCLHCSLVVDLIEQQDDRTVEPTRRNQKPEDHKFDPCLRYKYNFQWHFSLHNRFMKKKSHSLVCKFDFVLTWICCFSYIHVLWIPQSCACLCAGIKWNWTFQLRQTKRSIHSTRSAKRVRCKKM